MIFEDESVDLSSIDFNSRHEFYNCIFKNAHLSQAKLNYSLFEECTFKLCDLSNCSFTNSTLNDCTFKECKLIGVNWTYTVRVIDLKFMQSNLSFNVFTGLTLRDFIFEDCLLSESDFSESILDKSVFTDSNLDRAVFSNTSLKGCDLTKANHYSINPLNNILKDASFDKFDALSLLSFFDIKLK
jgi:uncharacterized protein YjbI with pentapeptide repeats